MPVTSNDLLRMARILVEGDDEISWRSAVNRAYYAAYHSLLEVCIFLPATGEKQRRNDRVSHAEVVARITQWKPVGRAACLQRMAASARVAAHDIRRTRSMRECADYQLADSIDKDDAKLQIARASQLCRFVIQVKTELKRSADASTSVH